MSTEPKSDKLKLFSKHSHAKVDAPVEGAMSQLLRWPTLYGTGEVAPPTPSDAQPFLVAPNGRTESSPRRDVKPYQPAARVKARHGGGGIAVPDPTAWPFCTVGRVSALNEPKAENQTQLSKSSTGVLVSGKVVLTTAHALYDLEKGDWRHDFYFGPEGGTGTSYPYATATILQAYADGDYRLNYGALVLRRDIRELYGHAAILPNRHLDLVLNVGCPFAPPYALQDSFVYAPGPGCVYQGDLERPFHLFPETYQQAMLFCDFTEGGDGGAWFQANGWPNTALEGWVVGMNTVFPTAGSYRFGVGPKFDDRFAKFIYSVIDESSRLTEH